MTCPHHRYGMNAPAAIFISPRRKNHSPPRQYSTAPLDIHPNRTRSVSLRGAGTIKPYRSQFNRRLIGRGRLIGAGASRPRNIANRMRIKGETNAKLKFRYQAKLILPRQNRQTISIRFATAPRAALIRPSQLQWSKTLNCRL